MTSDHDPNTAASSTVATSTEEPPAQTLDEFARSGALFAVETAELFASVRDHDLPTLSARCDDDLGIIDIDPNGGAEVIRDRAGWESWFVQLFAQLDAMDAATDTLITRYDAVDWGETGMGVVDFIQLLTVGGLTGRFHCIVTIVWKRRDDRWIEARWHASLLRTELPEGFGQPA